MGITVHCKNGVMHNMRGPAVTISGKGYESYYVNGQHISGKKFEFHYNGVYYSNPCNIVTKFMNAEKVWGLNSPIK